MIKSIGVYSMIYFSGSHWHYRYYVDLLIPCYGHAIWKNLKTITGDYSKANNFARRAAKRYHCPAYTLDTKIPTYSNSAVII